jgi:PTH1 family peptidyl-tRNA hydrolase
MLLFVGLGNIGKTYAGHRHNIGFMAVDQIARDQSCAGFRPRFQGKLGEISLAGVRVLLLKPETYMNESGRSVGEAVRFFKIDTGDVVVFHDELDLAPGKVRVKIGGGNAGHNGLKSVSAHIGNGYRRVRIGIGHPGAKELVHGYVLGDFARSEIARVETLCLSISANAELLAKGQDEAFQNKIHHAMETAGFGKDGPF